MTKTYHAIGLMSGSSLDGLDIAFGEFTIKKESGILEVSHWEILAAATYPLSGFWKNRLQGLSRGTAFALADAHAAFGSYLGQLVNQFFSEKKISPAKIDLIASHGHTIFHEPAAGFTTQIGDGAALAAATNCTVVNDFRSADIALGGQGAPIAPLADKMLLPGHDFYLNLGGIANITCNSNGRLIAFDICGANQVLNALANEKGLPYDNGGKIAATGQLIPDLFNQQKALSFFKNDYPKSLSNQWVLENQVKIFLENDHSTANKLFTACELIGDLIGEAIDSIKAKENFNKKNYSLLVTGGGAYNDYLIGQIKHYIQQKNIELNIPEKNIIEFKEALLMALLGVMRIEGVPNVFSSVTGAARDTVGGAVSKPS